MNVPDIDTHSIHPLRALCADGTRQVRSRYLRSPTDKAFATHELGQRTLRCDPLNPIWPSRDRFVESERDASANSTEPGR